MANTYLTRSVSSASNRKTWTWSAWVKRSNITSYKILFSSYSDNNNYTRILFWDTQQLTVSSKVAGNFPIDYRLTRRFRDTSAWYHIVVAMDTTQATDTNRLKIYINGVLETAYEGSSSSLPSQNEDTFINNNNAHYIGQQGDNSEYFDGLMSHIHMIDGTAYDASAFGETDTTTGEWKAKTSPSVTYGTNGFFILKDGNGITDQSGEGNDFTLGGGTLTDLKDNPDNVFATLNPLDKGLGSAAAILANGNNTTMASSGLGDYGLRSTLGASSGKYYFEIKVNGGNTATIGDMAANLVINMNDSSPASNFYGFQRYSDSSTNLYNNGTFVSQNTAMFGGIASGNIISVAVDLTNSKIFLQKNGGGWKNTSGATGDPVNGTNPTFTIADATKTYGFYCELRNNLDNETQMNFGNGYFGTTAITTNSGNGYSGAEGSSKFNYTVPTGYSALSTKGLNE